MADDKPKTQGPDRIREIHLVEVMETADLDGKLEAYGLPSDAKKSANGWRAKGRKARYWAQALLWS